MPFDSLNPIFTREAEFGRETFFTSLEDKEGDMISFMGVYDWKRDSEGVSLVSFDYWPVNKDMNDSVHDYVLGLLEDL